MAKSGGSASHGFKQYVNDSRGPAKKRSGGPVHKATRLGKKKAAPGGGGQGGGGKH